MTKPYLLEICVETLQAATAAERGGAQRIELCEQLAIGGVTPGIALLRDVRKAVKIPIHVMIRPRGGDFCFSPDEFDRMIKDIHTAREEGADGLALGILKCNRELDCERTTELVHAARPLPVTFHRAFDETSDQRAALENVVASGAARILTSGGAPCCEEGIDTLAELVRAAGDRIEILVGGGIHAGNLEQVARGTQAREFHSGLSSKLPYPRTDHVEFEREVAKLTEALGTLERC